MGHSPNSDRPPHILYQYSFYLQTLYKQPYHTGTTMAGVKHITPKFKAVSESENAVQLLLFYSLKLLLDIHKFHGSFSFPQHHMLVQLMDPNTR